MMKLNDGASRRVPVIILILTSLLVFSQPVHSQTEQNNSTDWKTYSNPIEGYKIQYPASWDLGDEDRDSLGGIIISAITIALKEKVTGDSLAEVELRRQQFPEQVQTLEDLRNHRITEFSNDNDFMPTKIINYSATTLSNEPAFKILFERPSAKLFEGLSSIPAKEVLTITTFNETSHEAFIISYFANPQLFDEYFPTVQKMINSLQFTN